MLAVHVDRVQDRQRQLQLIQVSTPQDLRLPEAAGLLLQDVESGDTLSCNNASGAADAAARRAAALGEKLQAWSRHRHAQLTRCDAGEGWREIILRHFTGS